MRTAAKRAIILAISIALAPIVVATGASLRDEVLKILEQLVSADEQYDRLTVWVNDGDGLPIEEGAEVSFHFRAGEDVHLTAVYLDADGKLILLYPAPQGTMLRGHGQLALEVGIATTPYGLESVFVVGSGEPISRRSLGIDSTETYVVLGHGDAIDVANRLRDIVVRGGATVLPSARVDFHIVPARSSGGGYSRGAIIRYFTAPKVRALQRPKLDLDIKFETGSAGLLPEARSGLDEVGAALVDKRLSDARFVFVGHTDHRGDTGYNQALSESRAEAARNYLIENHQIDPNRLRSMGRGESMPLLDRRDADAMRRNRRVELELVP